MKKDIILFGMPWAGKWTQAQLLKDYTNNQYVHLSTWDVFRALMSAPNAIGDLAKHRMNTWLLINDKVSMSLFDTYFYSVLEEEKYMLLDGYPRTIPQLNTFLAKCYEYGRELTAIYFDISDDVAIQRMNDRAREWETPDIIQTRLDKYYKYTKPIMDAYAAQQQLITIDASGTVEDIHTQVIKVLDQQSH